MAQRFSHITNGKSSLLVAAFFLVPSIAFWVVGFVGMGAFVTGLLASYFLLWGLAGLLSRTLHEELRKRFLLLTVMLLFSLAVLEVPGVLGIINYQFVFKTPSNNPWEEPGRVFDDELLWRGQPHYRQHIKYSRGNIGATLCLPPGPTREFDIRYDQNGFRNIEDFVTADIAVIGDSYVEAPMTEGSHLMTSVLAQLRKETVVNLGMAGHGPQHEINTLQRYVPQLHPKTIVWVFYGGNDLYDVGQYEVDKALFSRKGILSRLWERSLVKNALTAAIRVSRGCKPQPALLKQYGVLRYDNQEVRRYFLSTNSDLVPLNVRALEKVRAILQRAYRFSEERGIDFVLVYAPSVISVYKGSSVLIKASDEVESWEVSGLPDRLRAIAGDISPKMGYLNLTPTLLSAAERGVPIFIEDDTHWTDAGHRIVAKAINDFLNSRP